MTTDIKFLGWSIFLGLVYVFVAAGLGTQQRGLAWNAGNRDEEPKRLTGAAARAERANKNFLETFGFFAAAVLAVNVLKLNTAHTALGAQIYFWARLLYLPIYIAGIPYVRTLVWAVSLWGLLQVAEGVDMKNFVAGLLLVASIPGMSRAADAPSITVFAAASLTNALQEVGDAFTKETSIAVKFSFAASSTLARQIENGAPADVFFSADVEWMDYLQTRHLIEPSSRRDVLGNRLVLIAPVSSAVALKIGDGFALAAALGGGRLATGDPDSVPVGRYAQEALTHFGVWSTVSDRLVRADSVRSALAFVDRGEAPLGIVYETDALVDKKVRVVDVFPAGSHVSIDYPIALTSHGGAQAAKFLSYVSTSGDRIFKSYGFIPLQR